MLIMQDGLYTNQHYFKQLHSACHYTIFGMSKADLDQVICVYVSLKKYQTMCLY